MRDIVWFRGKDLRLQDHAGVTAGGPEAVHVFVIDPYFFAPDRAQQIPRRMQCLLDGLRNLSETLAARGGRLWCLKGRSVDVIPRLAQAVQAKRVLAMRWSEPFGRERDRRIAAALECPLDLVSGETLMEPGTLRSQAGNPYTVFSPFKRSFRREFADSGPVVPPNRFSPLAQLPSGWKAVDVPTLADLEIERNLVLPQVGEEQALKRLSTFLGGSGSRYSVLRDRMDIEGTSRLSVDIKFGLVSPASVWRSVGSSALPEAEKQKFTDELIWREFNYSTMWDKPEILKQPFKDAWTEFPWRKDERLWEAWATGLTGYPVVDAAARELLATGYVHNRARMISASFLTKHLRLDYRLGEAHYLKWLADGDWAQNNMGWQWAAGCGADAQPWFRVFNPMTQGRRFDPDGVYVRRWLPELASLDTRFVHAPWEAPAADLDKAGLKLGSQYPRPIVDHAAARTDFLAVAKAYLNGS